ncbi:F-actin-capping protein subunit alpha-3 [Sceloporus undulatus]|uniref:F-actin-capping protein subunit alpha-3 n=1 Tax=Sceloporus undulatus TaxID=8520 RepID=UPI001C4B4ADC|nr:F-actin-capping protein subunit alpha-3 [Sceloporus undulatus]
MISEEDELSNEEKIDLICSLLLQAPPGEFRNVFEDLRILICDDHLMRNEAAQVSANHTKKNFTPVSIRGDDSLVTRHNDLGGNRFFDPQIKLSFRFDHLSRRADKILLYHVVRKDTAELWRETLNVALESYVKKHFHSGTCRVYRKSLRGSPFFVICIEGHQYKKFWNAFWKSEWILPVTPPNTQVTGSISVQLHYFKKANLHFTATNTIEVSMCLINRAQFALDFEKLIEGEDNKLQTGLLKSLQILSDEVWSVFRRQLPVTRTAICWNKLLTY